MITFVEGDLFDSNMQTLVNTINCVGVMGKGIAKEFKERFPSVFVEYQVLCVNKDVFPYLHITPTGQHILNFPTKDHWRFPSKLEYITNGLDWFVTHYQGWGITSIAFPPLGCGNGGLRWSQVASIMQQKLSAVQIPIEIYAAR